MKIEIKNIPWATFEMNEDGEFKCNHEDAEMHYEQGGDGITEPRGGWVVECPAWDCTGIEDWEFDGLMDRLTPEEPDYE